MKNISIRYFSVYFNKERREKNFPTFAKNHGLTPLEKTDMRYGGFVKMISLLPGFTCKNNIVIAWEFLFYTKNITKRYF